MEKLRGETGGFEQQFSAKKETDSLSGKITFVDVKPEALVDDVPILFLPGWTENLDTYRDSLKLAYDRGRRAMSFEFSRKGGDGYRYRNAHEELRKAFQISAVLKDENIEEVDIIMHSYAAIYGSLLASRLLNVARNVVYDRPMGMAGPENKLMLLRRWISNRLNEGKVRSNDPDHPTSQLQVKKRTASYIGRNFLRAFQEAKIMSEADISPHIRNMYREGTMIAIIAGTEDLMAPYDKQIKELAHKSVPVDGFYPVNGPHNSISIDPEKYTTLALDALSWLQIKRQKQQTNFPRFDYEDPIA